MKKILYIVFVFNFLFSLLTAILPIITFEITNSSAISGYVLTIFMISLLFIRIMLIKYNLNLTKIAIIGLLHYSFGFFILFLFPNNIIYFYIGAILFGIGVGSVAPALITLITSLDKDTNKMVGFYNSFMGVASATAPFVGVFLFYYYSNKHYLYLLLFIASISALVVSFFISNKKVTKNGVESSNLAHVFLNSEYLLNYSTFLMVSISYGSIIAFLPILLEQYNIGIGVFYFFYWTFFIVSQFYVPKLSKFIKDNYLLISFILLLSMSTFSISIFKNYIGFIAIAIVFGFCYGALTNLFYIRIAAVKDNKFKSDAFSIFGLMSYLGVGLGSFIFSSLADVSLNLLFLFSSIFPILSLVIVLSVYILKTFKNKEVNSNNNKTIKEKSK